MPSRNLFNLMIKLLVKSNNLINNIKNNNREKETPRLFSSFKSVLSLSVLETSLNYFPLDNSLSLYNSMEQSTRKYLSSNSNIQNDISRLLDFLRNISYQVEVIRTRLFSLVRIPKSKRVTTLQRDMEAV